MGTENDNNFETVIIEGEVWAVTNSGGDASTEAPAISDADEPGEDSQETQQDIVNSSDPVDPADISSVQWTPSYF